MKLVKDKLRSMRYWFGRDTDMYVYKGVAIDTFILRNEFISMRLMADEMHRSITNTINFKYKVL